MNQIWTFEHPSRGPLIIGLPPAADGPLTVTVDGEDLEVDLLEVDDNHADLVAAGVRRRVSVVSDAASHQLVTGGWQIALVEQALWTPVAEGGAGGPAAPLPGTVVSVEASVGDTVVEGQLLVVLEAMKMEHRIVADVAGTVTSVLVSPGDRVDAHQVLVTVAPGDRD